MSEEQNNEEKKDFVSKLVPPHTKKSREVTEDDLFKVAEDSHVLYNICHSQIGPIPGAFAMHHSQVDDVDPLNFFVTKDMEVVINPTIINHTRVPVDRVEGCVSFPWNKPIIVPRYNKIIVEYSLLTTEGEIGGRQTKNLSGVDAQIYQHEAGHANGELIYEIIKNNESNQS